MFVYVAISLKNFAKMHNANKACDLYYPPYYFFAQIQMLLQTIPYVRSFCDDVIFYYKVF
jgi:hypothetical protein